MHYFLLTSNQTVYNILFSMLAQAGQLDTQQLLHLSLSKSNI